jgi:tetrathionate reductase subunit A
MTDKKLSPEQSQDTEADRTDASRRRMLLRGGAVAGGLAAFAAGYGETVAKGAKG